MKTCPYCKMNDLQFDATHCPHCGKDIRTSTLIGAIGVNLITLGILAFVLAWVAILFIH